MLAFVLIVQTCWIVFTFLYWFNFQIRNHFKAVVTSFFFYYYFSIQWTLLWLGLPSWRLDAALHLSADMLSLQFWLIHRLLLWAVAALPDPSHGFSRHVLVIRQPLPFPQHPLAKGPVMWSVIWGQKWCMHQAEVKKCGLCRILLAHYLLHRLVQGLKKLLRFWKNKGIRWICKKPVALADFHSSLVTNVMFVVTFQWNLFQDEARLQHVYGVRFAAITTVLELLDSQ